MKTIVFATAILMAVNVSFINGQVKPNEDFMKKIEEIAGKFSPTKPTPDDPVTVAAKLIWSEQNDQFAIVFKSSIMDEWKIYAFVPESQPYLQTELELKFPEQVKAVDEWSKPPPKPYEQGVQVYTGDLLFTRVFQADKASVSQDTLKCSLFYQACDNNMCLPPRTKTIELKLSGK